MSDRPGPAGSEEVAQKLLIESANRGEAIASVLRGAFCALVLIRFAALGDLRGPDRLSKSLLELPLLSLAVIGSSIAFVLARRIRFRPSHLVASCGMDAAVCFVSLLSNMLWPDGAYQRLLRMPDAAAIIPIVFASALRLTPSASALSGVANTSSLLALVAFDGWANGPRLTYGWQDVALVLIFVGSSSFLAYVTSVAAKRLVYASGMESARVERARRHLGALLREHHDVRSLLSSANLQVELAARERDGAKLPERLEAIRRAIAQLSDFVESVKVRAFAEMAVIEGAEPVDVSRSLAGAAEAVRRRFPSVDIALPQLEPLDARVLGGERALAHVLVNLLVNACEGDGQRQAQRVEVKLERRDGAVVIEVADDGPGFPPHLLSSRGTAGLTTKAAGSGLGMMLVAGVVESSGGRLELGNRPSGGACVRVQLPAA